MLPHINGLDLCRIIRGESEVPIIILTAKDAEADKVAGLEIGADDYVTKPFSMRELVTRVRAHLRRASMASVSRPEGAGGNLVAGPIQMDTRGPGVDEGGFATPGGPVSLCSAVGVDVPSPA